MKPRLTLLLTFVLSAALLSPQPALLVSAISPQTPRRDLRLAQSKPVTTLPVKAKRWALVIGVDQYRDDQISSLKGAANDAKTLAEALTRYAGFPADQVILLATDQPDERQPTRVNILRRLSNLVTLVPKDGLLLVSFAGHGMERSGQAFLIPTDAQLGDDISFLEETAISVTRMKDRIRAVGVGQVLMLLDACRNDPVGRANTTNPLTEAFVNGFNFDVRNREVTAFATLYATAVGQRAYEYSEKRQGYFTWAVVQAMSGAAANDKGEVTLSALLKYVQDTVPKLISIDLGAGKQQKPFAITEGYKADELVIAAVPVRIPDTAANTPPPNTDTSAATELSFWEAIRTSTDPADYEAYLEKWPNGTFATLARRRAKAKAADATPTNPAPVNPNSTPAKSSVRMSVAGVPLTAMTFTTANVDASGKVINKRQEQCQGFTEDVGNGVRLEMIEIPAGEFMMGSTDAEVETAWAEAKNSDKETKLRWIRVETPQHRVSVPAFAMGKYEITQGQYQAVMGKNPSHFRGDDLPLDVVSWEDAVEFCLMLSAKTGRQYRLPSEAEWEYAARAGTTTPFAFGETITPQIVNHRGLYPYGIALKGTSWDEIFSVGHKKARPRIHTEKGTFRERTVSVGSLGVANAFGLYDLHGNVWEWCQDMWHDNYNGAPTDGAAWISGGDQQSRVLRGGSWYNYGWDCRSANRFNFAHGASSIDFGFRVVVSARTQ